LTLLLDREAPAQLAPDVRRELINALADLLLEALDEAPEGGEGQDESKDSDLLISGNSS
jgi:hypothetical protein